MLQDSYLGKRDSDTALENIPENIDNDLLEDGEIPAKLTLNEMNNLCVVCMKNSHKYKCPNCLEKHCSLPCYNIHKNSNKCSGQVEPTKFVKLNSYTASNLRRDFDFQSDIITNSNKTRKKLSILDENLTKQKELLRYKILKLNARKRNVVISNAPPIIQRHRKNISFYYTKDKIIYWGQELFQYVCVDEENCKVFRWNFQPNPESRTLKEMLVDFPWDNDELILAFKGQLTVESLCNILKNEKDTAESSKTLTFVNEKDDSSSFFDTKFNRQDNNDYNLLTENTYFTRDLFKPQKKEEPAQEKPQNQHSKFHDNKNFKILGELDERIIKQIKSNHNPKKNQENIENSDQDDNSEDNEASQEIEDMLNDEDQIDSVSSDQGNEATIQKNDEKLNQNDRSNPLDNEKPKQEKVYEKKQNFQKDSHFTTSYIKLELDMKIENFVHSMKINEFPTQHQIPEKMMGALSRKIRRKLELIELN